MPSTILDTFSSPTTVTITLASLAASSVGVGRQGTIVDNTGSRYQDVMLFIKITLGTSPTGNRGVYVYLIRDNGAATAVRTDGAGASDAALTIRNAELIGMMNTGTSPATGTVLTDSFLIRRPGPKWTIAIVNDSGVTLNGTAGNHSVTFVGMNPQSQ